MRSVSIDFVKFITVCNLPEVPVGSLMQLSAFREEPDGKLLGAITGLGRLPTLRFPIADVDFDAVMTDELTAKTGH